MSEERKIRVEGRLAYVPLTRGYESVIDVEDIQVLGDGDWYALSPGHSHAVYAARNEWLKGGKRNMRYLHRAILEAPAGLVVDHIDGDGLNNRRSNLRLCTHQQNLCNSRLNVNNTSGYKGVNWSKEKRKWRAEIWVNKKYYHLGWFQTADEAHKAYCRASKELHGSFGRIA